MNIFQTVRLVVLSFLIAFPSYAAEASHQSVARAVFHLLPSAEAIRKLYGQNKVIDRPSNDVFFAQYRETYIRILTENYSEPELRELEETLQSGGQIDADILESLLHPANESIYRAMMSLSESKESDENGRVVPDLEGGK